MSGLGGFLNLGSSGSGDSGGIGNSKSSQSQTTTTIDGRIAGGDSSTNLSLNGNTGPVSITTTDAGAIHDSLAVALAGVEGADKTAQAATANVGSLLDGALQTVQAQQAGFTSAIEQIKTGDTTVKYVMAGIAAAVIGLAVLFHKKG